MCPSRRDTDTVSRPLLDRLEVLRCVPCSEEEKVQLEVTTPSAVAPAV